MVPITLPLILFGGLYTIFCGLCLASNYIRAKRIGVPLVVLPVSLENPLWLLFGDSIVAIIKRLFGESRFTRFSIRGWVYFDKYAAALELGDHFAFVTRAKIWFFVCDARTLNEVFQRSHDFQRPLEILGKPLRS